MYLLISLYITCVLHKQKNHVFEKHHSKHGTLRIQLQFFLNVKFNAVSLHLIQSRPHLTRSLWGRPKFVQVVWGFGRINWEFLCKKGSQGNEKIFDLSGASS